MSTHLDRRPLTDLLLTTMAAQTGKPVGDSEANKTCGWQGQPNASGSNFVPYNILIPQSASTSFGPTGDTQADWQLPYSIWSYGVKRKQCEALADLARESLNGIRSQTFQLKDQRYSVMQVRTETIGGINRYDVTDPAYFGQLDVVSIWLTKEF